MTVRTGSYAKIEFPPTIGHDRLGCIDPFRGTGCTQGELVTIDRTTGLVTSPGTNSLGFLSAIAFQLLPDAKALKEKAILELMVVIQEISGGASDVGDAKAAEENLEDAIAHLDRSLRGFAMDDPARLDAGDKTFKEERRR